MLEKDKLSLLYMLNSAGIRLSETQLIRMAGDFLKLFYFDLKNALIEMEQTQLITSYEEMNGTFFDITESGVSTLECLKKKVSYTLRLKLDEFLTKNRDLFILENRVFTQCIQLSENQIRVNLKLFENNIPIFELSFLVMDKGEAARFIEGFRKNPMAVYHASLGSILQISNPL